MPSSSTPPADSSAGVVYLVDDEPSVRRAVTRLLRASGFAATSFATADEFLAARPPEDVPSCVLLDLRMPGMNGLELQELMGRGGLQLPIIFISGRADVGSGVRAMKGGAEDFLQKPISAEELIASVERAIERHRQRLRTRTETTLLQTRFSRLTPREQEVFVLVTRGLANKQVSAELGASEKTIKVHRARVMDKMEAGSLADLVRMADTLRLGARSTEGVPESRSSAGGPRPSVPAPRTTKIP
jgi:FixJ family two-component response regulator